MSTGLNSLANGRFLWVVLVLALVCMPCAMVLAADEAAGGDDVQVELRFGTGVDSETRALIGESTEFAAGIERVFCFSAISGADAPTTLTHAWYFKGKTKARVDLNIGASTWRTWSSKKIMSHWVGPWEVKVLDEAGQVLATGNFVIK